MKWIVDSILIVLALSVILALLVPHWSFRGDTRRTYQNDATRVDVSFGGHLKNGRMGAEEIDTNISQPAWLSDRSYQGAMVEFPEVMPDEAIHRGRHMGEGCPSYHRILERVCKEVKHRPHYIINRSVDDAVPLPTHTSTEAGTKSEQGKCV